MLMKRLFTLMIVALLATGISHACMRKSISVDYPITVRDGYHAGLIAGRAGECGG